MKVLERDRQATDLFTFRDSADALFFLRSLLADPFNIRLLRDSLAEASFGLDVSALSDQEVIEQLAQVLISGRLRIGRVKLPIAPVGETVAPAETEEEEEEEHATVVPTVETTWIEIELVNADDDPVPDQEYKVALPDGTEQTGNLDSDGKAMIRDITQKGDCVVSFPGLDAAAWDTAGSGTAADASDD